MGSTASLTYFAVSFSLTTGGGGGGSGGSVQSGSANIAANSANSTVNITTVNTSKAFLMFSYSIIDSDPQCYHVGGYLASATQITFQRYASTGCSAASIYYYVTEFNDTSNVTVQRGSTEINASAPQNVTLNTAVNLSTSFPVLSFYSAGTTTDANDYVRASITTTTNLQLDYDNSHSNGQSMVYWQVVNYPNSNVQTGNVTIGASNTSVTATLSSSVNTTHAWLLFTNDHPNTTQNPSVDLLRGAVTNSTILTFDRGSSAISLNIWWYVIEFMDGTTVQTANQNFGSSDTVKNVNITSINTTRSIASAGGMYYTGGKTTHSTSGESYVDIASFALTSSTNLSITRGAAAGTNTDMQWSVVEFGDSVTIPENLVFFIPLVFFLPVIIESVNKRRKLKLAKRYCLLGNNTMIVCSEKHVTKIKIRGPCF